MRFSKKASMQLSINAIVILVLAMAILGLGLGIVKMVKERANDINIDVDLSETADSTKNPTSTNRRPVEVATGNGSRMGRRRKPLLPTGPYHPVHQRQPNLPLLHRPPFRKILRWSRLGKET